MSEQIFNPGTVRTYRWWQKWLLWFLPTYYYVENHVVVIAVKHWRGKVYIWSIRP